MNIRSASIRLTRKQQNLQLASRLVNEQVDSLYRRFLSVEHIQDNSVLDSFRYLSDQSINLNNEQQLAIMESEFEAAKLLYQTNEKMLDGVEVKI